MRWKGDKVLLRRLKFVYDLTENRLFTYFTYFTYPSETAIGRGNKVPHPIHLISLDIAVLNRNFAGS
ncbi:MAG: hypothetical protein RL213_1161 [Bacteroidota bacterium]|jgi:hypothetical protein